MLKSIPSTKVIRIFTLLTMMLLGLSVHGFTRLVPSDINLKKKQPKPISSTKFIKVQDGVQLNVKDGTIVSLSLSEKTKDKAKWQDLIGSKYIIGDIHATDVTPQLWRKLRVRLRKQDRSTAEITMLRPLWWLQATKAREGDYLHLTVPEANISGKAKVLNISQCDFDSRKLKTGKNIVISKIKHKNAQTISITIGNEKIGVTPNHHLYSLTHNAWVAAGRLKAKDKLKTAGQTVKIIRVEKSTRKIVYNLEVHRAKSYYVGKSRVLAHNTGPDCNPTTLLPDSYWQNKQAPLQITPTGRIEMIETMKASSKSGKTYRSITHYDQYGRMIGQTHHSHHGYINPSSSQFHPNPHHHRYHYPPKSKNMVPLKNPKYGRNQWPGLYGSP